MENGEISTFFKVWFSVVISLCYSYLVGKKFPKGTARLLCLLPVVCLFTFLPLNLHTIHLGGTTAFFIAWLANFKLLLFAFGNGPLSSSPSLSLPRFLAVACLPIKIQQNPHLNGHNNKQNIYRTPVDDEMKPRKGNQTPVNFAIKIVVFALFLRTYDYSDHIHPTLMLVMYSFHIYIFLEIVMAVVATLARALLSLELERQFNEPYLSTSLQDFWGRRWNIMVTGILRPTVYDPLLKIFSRFVGRKRASIPAVFGTFVVSAMMHELIFFYLGRVRPTWEITCFFLLHGACLIAEIAVKKALGDNWRFPWVVSAPLTVGFVMLTGFWLFFPPLLRCRTDERAMEEYAATAAFFRNVMLR